MYSARAEIEDTKLGEKFSWKTVLICAAFVVTALLAAYVMVQQGRKKKTIHARVWHPPPPDSCKALLIYGKFFRRTQDPFYAFLEIKANSCPSVCRQVCSVQGTDRFESRFESFFPATSRPHSFSLIIE